MQATGCCLLQRQRPYSSAGESMTSPGTMSTIMAAPPPTRAYLHTWLYGALWDAELGRIAQVIFDLEEDGELAAFCFGGKYPTQV